MSKNINLSLRKNIISFALTWASLLIFLGIISLFSIWEMLKTFEKGTDSAFAISTLKGELSSANVSFKVEIQEWKNILLRGRDENDRLIFESKFIKENKKIKSYFNNASAICSQLNLNAPCQEIETVKLEHDQLMDQFNKNLLNASLKTYDSMQTLDESVRGLDRPLAKKMANLTMIFSMLENTKRLETKDLIHSKYDVLKNFILISMCIVLFIIGFSLYRSLRSLQN